VKDFEMRAVLVLALALASSSVSAQSGRGGGGIGNLTAQSACLSGQVYDPNTRSCITPTAGQDLTGYYIGGALILSGVIGALVLANSGDKTVSP
jgi:hypothetical protein